MGTHLSKHLRHKCNFISFCGCLSTPEFRVQQPQPQLSTHIVFWSLCITINAEEIEVGHVRGLMYCSSSQKAYLEVTDKLLAPTDLSSVINGLFQSFLLKSWTIDRSSSIQSKPILFYLRTGCIIFGGPGSSIIFSFDLSWGGFETDLT